jgi:hypothetical protein
LIVIKYPLGCTVGDAVVGFPPICDEELAMSRAKEFGPQAACQDDAAADTGPIDSAKVAEDIGIAVLELADRARDAGLSSIGYLLEMVALEAGAEAAARQWPVESADG